MRIGKVQCSSFFDKVSLKLFLIAHICLQKVTGLHFFYQYLSYKKVEARIQEYPDAEDT